MSEAIISRQIPEELQDPKVLAHIEGYAKALTDLLWEVTGDTPAMKTYDPMTIRDGVMHSYAFNLKDGGRHHPLQDYESAEGNLRHDAERSEGVACRQWREAGLPGHKGFGP